jgi:hypothetical protein
MPTSARKRRNFDMGRLREAMRGPGADTRVWLMTARVDDDPDAIVLDPELGWIVDVTVYGGPLDQEGPIPCRLGMPSAGDQATKSCPVTAGCEVLVAVSDGDANSNPIIVARMHNAGGCSFPLLVNGTPITEAYAKANEILVTELGADEQYGGDRRVTAPNQTLESEGTHQVAAPTIWLGGIPATEVSPSVPPRDVAVLGNALVVALNAYALAMAGGTIPPTAPAAPVTQGQAAAAATALVTALTAALSGKVTLD